MKCPCCFLGGFLCFVTPCPKRQWSLVSVQLLPSSSFSSTVYHVSTIITTYPSFCFTFRRHIVRQRRQYLAYTCGKYVDHIVHRDNTTFLIPCYHVNYTACPDTMYELLLLVCATSSIGCLMYTCSYVKLFKVKR